MHATQVLDHLDSEPDTVSEWEKIENSLNACAAKARQRVKLEKTIAEQRETFNKHDWKNFEPVPRMISWAQLPHLARVNSGWVDFDKIDTGYTDCEVIYTASSSDGTTDGTTYWACVDSVMHQFNPETSKWDLVE